MPYLRVVKGPNLNKSYPLEKERIILGRNATCDIVFPPNDFAVSREHACVLRVQNKFFVEDMGSRNGTYVNNQPIAGRTPLKDNDTIRICDSIYSFHEATTSVFKAPAAATADKAPLDEQTIEEENEVFPFEASISSASNHFLESQPAEKLRAMVEITNNLSKTLELEPLLPKIADSLFQIFKQADRCFIIFNEEVTERDKVVEKLMPKVIKTRRGQDESSASYSRSIVRECIKTVQAFLSDDASSDKRFSMAQSIADFRIRSVMCAPLWSQETNKAFGVIQLDTQDRSKKFTQEDLGILMAVASQASVALDNAKMHEQMVTKEKLKRDMQLAQQVQQSFLPLELPKVDGYEFFALYESAQEIGGDYYGFIALPNIQKLAILLGDVAGKGIPAALLMAKLSSDARFSLMSQPEPAPALCQLNDFVYQNTSQMDRFITLAMVLLEPLTHKFTLVNAGHPAPLIYRKATDSIERSSKDIIGLPMGIMEGYPYESADYELNPGDFIIVFSDGVTEPYDLQGNAVNEKAIEVAIAEGAKTPKALGERAIKLLKQYTAGKPQHDDITMVCFGRV